MQGEIIFHFEWVQQENLREKGICWTKPFLLASHRCKPCYSGRIDYNLLPKAATNGALVSIFGDEFCAFTIFFEKNCFLSSRCFLTVRLWLLQRKYDQWCSLNWNNLRSFVNNNLQYRDYNKSGAAQWSAGTACGRRSYSCNGSWKPFSQYSKTDTSSVTFAWRISFWKSDGHHT